VRPVFKQPKTEEEKENNKPKRDAFKEALKEELRSLAKNYEGQDICGDTHIQTIRAMAERLKNGHTDILNGEKLVFGVAAKALNVYLKYLYCSGFDVRPPHCPFDYDLIAMLKPPAGVEYKWTYAEEADYRVWVSLALATAKGGGFDSLSAWEVVTWAELQKKRQEQEQRALAKKKAKGLSDDALKAR